MKIAFFGTGKFSTQVLEKIILYTDIEIEFVVSQPDKRVGRKNTLQATEIKSFSILEGIKVIQPTTLKSDMEIEKLSKELDFFVVVAYGKIIPEKILNLPKYGSINLHGSLLPLYRGASPIQESLKQGDQKTGLTTMYMSAGMDEGDILLQQNIEIKRDDTQLDIFKEFSLIGPKLLHRTLAGVISGNMSSIVQDENLVSYCSKIQKEDGKISFTTQTAQDIYNTYRAYYGWPGIYNYYKGIKLQIEKCNFDSTIGTFETDIIPGSVFNRNNSGKMEVCILCHNGVLILEQVKLAGKKSMDIKDFINGYTDFLDYKFD